jgi:hypothetical protein
MRHTQIGIVIATLGILLGTSGLASAADDAKAKDDKGSSGPKLFSFGVGVLGQIGGDFLTKPDDRTLPGQSQPDTRYPGFAGFGTGGGLMLDTRFLGIVGLEIDFIRSSDHGKGDIDETFNGKTTSYSLEVGQSSWHMPILLKGTIPLPVFAPFAVIGPEFVFPSDATAQTELKSGTNFGIESRYAAKAEGYTLITFGIGFEFKLPLPFIDLRIPFSIRGSVNPSTPSSLQDRLVNYKAGDTTQTVKSEWQYQARATLGAALYF